MEQTTKYVGVDGGEYLLHFGILGMKWGVRRFQNPDGSLTEAGKRRYYKEWKRSQNSDYEVRKAADKKYFGEHYHATTDKELEKAKRGKRDALEYALQKEHEYDELNEQIIDEAFNKVNATYDGDKSDSLWYMKDSRFQSLLDAEESKIRERRASELEEKEKAANMAAIDYNNANRYLENLLDKRVADYAPSNLSERNKRRVKAAIRNLEPLYEEWN